MHAKYEVSISYGSKVTAKVKVDNRQTDKQTGQKQYAPIIQSGGIKTRKLPPFENFHVYSIIYEMNFSLCVLLVYNDNGSVQTLCITRVSALCTKCLQRPIVIINQQYTKGEIHFIYLHYFHVFWFCFINRYHGNGCVSLENPTVCTVNGRA